MVKYAKCFVALCFSLAVLLVYAAPSNAQQNPVTAIDIALEPDATMIQHAQADNARLLKAFPKGFALDATHHPHITMLQQFVRTADLDKVYAAANKVLASEKPTSWKLKAFKYYYIPSPPIGLAGIVVEPTEDLHQAATRTNRRGYAFHGENWDPRSVHEHREWPRHPTVLDRLRGQFCDRSQPVRNSIRTSQLVLAPIAYLKKMLAEPFEAFTFSPAGASVYQLGSFGTARKELKALVLTP